MCCSASNCLHIFCCCFCCWVLLLMHCDQIECTGLFLFLYICWSLLCALKYDQFWRKLNGLLRRIYVVQMLDEIFCRHQLGPFDLSCDLVLEFLYWFFCLGELPIGDWGYYILSLLCWSLYVLLRFIEYVWWNWVNWHWVQLSW
jgi:hypothetical protein